MADPSAAMATAAMGLMAASMGGAGRGKGGFGGGKGKGKSVCFSARDYGSCEKGANCWYSHVDENGKSLLTKDQKKKTLSGKAANARCNKKKKEVDSDVDEDTHVDYDRLYDDGEGATVTVTDTKKVIGALTSTTKDSDDEPEPQWRVAAAPPHIRDIIMEICARLHPEAESAEGKLGMKISKKYAEELLQALKNKNIRPVSFKDAKVKGGEEKEENDELKEHLKTLSLSVSRKPMNRLRW